MPVFHVDQRPARARCVAALAMVPGAARLELLQTLDRARRVRDVAPEAAAAVLLDLRSRGDLLAYGRFVERAIPVRGAVRPWRFGAAELASIGALAGLWWIAPVLALAVAGVALAVAVGWLFVAAAPAVAIARMEQAARAAKERGDGAALSTILADAHRMIAEDRVPAGTGRWFHAMLRAAVDAEPYPVELLDDLRRLRDLAPEVAAVHDDAERSIEHQLAQRRGRDPGKEDERRRVLADYRRIHAAAVGGQDDDRVAAMVTAMHRAASWAAEAGDAKVLCELHDDARALIERGRIPAGSGVPLAEVLRDRAAAMPFKIKLLDELDVLRALAPEVGAEIVDVATDRLAAHLDGIGNLPALRAIARAFDHTSSRARDPAIAEHARRLAARAREVYIVEHRLAQESGRDPAAVLERPRVLADYRRARDAAAGRLDDDLVAALVTSMRDASSWAVVAGDVEILGELHDGARAVIELGRIPAGMGIAIAEVLRDGAGVMPFALKLVGELDALRAMAPEVDAALVDAALDRLGTQLDGITNRPALREIATELDQAASCARDPAIAERARRLAARARELQLGTRRATPPPEPAIRRR